MLFLAIDSSQDICHIALFQQHVCLEHIAFEDLSQSKILLPTITILLKNHQISLTDLTAIAVCIGPGSFTGTRIGVMTAKSLSYASKIPLIPFHSLLPYTAPGTLPVIAAKRDEYFSLDQNLAPKLYTSKELAEIRLPFLSPNPSSISPKVPHITIEKSPYQLDKIASFIVEKISSKSYEDPLHLEVCYLRSPM